MLTDELRRGGDINRRQRDVWLVRGGEMQHLTENGEGSGEEERDSGSTIGTTLSSCVL